MAALEEARRPRPVPRLSHRRSRHERAAGARGAHAPAAGPLPGIPCHREGLTAMDKESARTVAETVRALFHSVHDELRKEVRDLDHGTLNWRPLPKANSVAVLVVHTLGSEREMIRALRKIPTDRDRDAEFRLEPEAADLL